LLGCLAMQLRQTVLGLLHALSRRQCITPAMSKDRGL